MRVLMITSPSVSHFLPMVPLAWAIRAAGHDILVAGQPDVLSAVGQAGLQGVRVGRRAGIDDSVGELVRPGLRPFEWVGRWTPEMMAAFPPVWQRHSEDVLPGYRDLARRYRPDLIVCDVMEFNALAVGALSGIPVVRHRYGIDPLSHVVAPAARAMLRPVHERLGLAELPEPAAVLDPAPAALQVPEATPGLPVRYVPYNGSGTPAEPPMPRDANERVRRVLVSLGSRTLDLNGVPLLRGVLAAFEGLPDVEAVATVPEGFRTELGPVPREVRLSEPVPLNLVTEGCAAVVHHGGSGTGMTAACHGVPQLVLPQIADAFAYADRLPTTGAGMSVDTVAQQNDPDYLHKSLEALLGDPSYREGAERLRRDIDAMPPPAALVPRLERVAAGESA